MIELSTTAIRKYVLNTACVSKTLKFPNYPGTRKTDQSQTVSSIRKWGILN